MAIQLEGAKSLKRAVTLRTRDGMYVIAKGVVRRVETSLGRASLVGDAAFFGVGSFSWADRIERDWHLIRHELDEVLQHREQLMNFQDLSAGGTALTDDNQWKTYVLYGYGFRSDANCRRCPETARLCGEIPGMKRAFFSILSPHKHIPAHHGPYKGILRYHLGLRIPEPRESCRIRVGDEVRHWEEGRSMIFDDTYEHEVWNDTEGVRVVLFVDFMRPLSLPWNLVNSLVLKATGFSPSYTDVKRRERDWEARFEALKASREPAGPAPVA